MSKTRILICDDEEGVRESLKLILEERFDLQTAENGEEAVQHVASAPFDVMLLDIKMPRMDGMETLKRVRQLAPSMPVLILTAYHSVDIAKEAVRLGAHDYLSKPFDKAELLGAIEQLLRKSRNVTY